MLQGLRAHSLALAKVVIVGNSGVGKTGLALRLSSARFELTESTHGMQHHRWSAQVTPTNRGVESREVVLWDLAGQADYQLIHQLFLDDISVGLVVVDMSDAGWQADASSWSLAIDRATRSHCRKFLVAARIDRGPPRSSSEVIDRYVQEEGYSGFASTSAKTGEGVDDLRARTLAAIDWDELPTVFHPESFSKVLASINHTSASKSLVDGPPFRRELVRQSGLGDSEVEAAVALASRSGYLYQLTTVDAYLLRVELLSAAASTVALEARRHPDGLGCLNISDLDNVEFGHDVQELPLPAHLSPTLYREVVSILIARGIAFVEGPRLVLPSKAVRRRAPADEASTAAELVVSFAGPSEAAYATLAVRLAYSAVFQLRDLFDRSADFRDPFGKVCRVDVLETRDGSSEFTVYVAADAAVESKALFCAFVVDHVRSSAHGGRISVDWVVRCSVCAYEIPRDVVRRRRDRGRTDVACSCCDLRFALAGVVEERGQDAILIDRMHTFLRFADSRIISQEALPPLHPVPAGPIVRGDGFNPGAPPQAVAVGPRHPKPLRLHRFDAFLAYSSSDREVVVRVANGLRSRGLLPWLDIWNVRPGQLFQEAIQEALTECGTFAVTVSGNGIGPWVRLEILGAISLFVESRRPVIPVLLPGSGPANSLPIFLREFHCVDIRAGLNDLHWLDQFEWAVTGQARPP